MQVPSPIQQLALHLLYIYELAQADSEALQGPFCDLYGSEAAVPFMPDKLHRELIILLDEILGEKLVSYYLYDCGREGLITTADGRAFPITSVDDIRQYLMNRPASQP